MFAINGTSTRKTNLRSIFFDLDGTLLHLDPPGPSTFHTYAREMGVPVTAANARSAERWINRYWAQSEELFEDTNKYGPRDNNGAFWRNHARRHLNMLGVNGNRAVELAARITERMIAEYQPNPHVPQEVYETLSALQERGYFLGMVSNRQVPLRPVLEEYGLSDFFEIACSAGEVGFWKPDPRILLSAVSNTAHEIEQTAYVGDNFYADVGAARAAGALPILLDPMRLFPQVRCLRIRRIAELQELFH